jgi:MFS family permease
MFMGSYTAILGKTDKQGMVIGAIILACCTGGCLWTALSVSSILIWILGWIGFFVFGVVLLALPVLAAHDVSDNIPKVKALKASDKQFKDVTIKHKDFSEILSLNGLAGAGSLLWLVLFIFASGSDMFAYTSVTIVVAWTAAFFWALSPSSVALPQSVLEALEGNASSIKPSDKEPADQAAVELEQPSAENTAASSAASLEQQLRETQGLLESGLITEAEAQERRQALLKKV